MAEDLTLRTCGRAGCRWPAAASLSFRYATGQVWLLDLSPEPDPALYDLCPHHADTLTVPNGWQRADQRRAQAVVAEPAGRDLDPDGGGAPPGAGGYGGNRYAALLAALPRLAREHRAGEASADGEPEGVAAAPGRSGAPRGALAERARPPALPSRDLAPMPVELPWPLAGEAPPDAPGAASQGEGSDEGVVVPIEEGARRRG